MRACTMHVSCPYAYMPLRNLKPFIVVVLLFSSLAFSACLACLVVCRYVGTVAIASAAGVVKSLSVVVLVVGSSIRQTLYSSLSFSFSFSLLPISFPCLFVSEPSHASWIAVRTTYRNRELYQPVGTYTHVSYPCVCKHAGKEA